MIKLRHIAPVLALSLFAVRPAHASLIMEIADSQDFADQMNGSPTYTLGWSFTTNQSISVIALDAYDIFGDGFVELYDSRGDVLASATLTASDAQEGSPTLFYTRAITPVVLAANTTYYIAQDICGSAEPCSGANFVGTHFFGSVPPQDLFFGSQISYSGPVGVVGYGQTPTSDTVQFGNVSPSYFGPNFNIAPEPSTFLPGFSATLLGFVGLRRHEARETR